MYIRRNRLYLTRSLAFRGRDRERERERLQGRDGERSREREREKERGREAGREGKMQNDVDIIHSCREYNYIPIELWESSMKDAA